MDFDQMLIIDIYNSDIMKKIRIVYLFIFDIVLISIIVILE